jgi:hypothetical protein
MKLSSKRKSTSVKDGCKEYRGPIDIFCEKNHEIRILVFEYFDKMWINIFYFLRISLNNVKCTWAFQV